MVDPSGEFLGLSCLSPIYRCICAYPVGEEEGEERGLNCQVDWLFLAGGLMERMLIRWAELIDWFGWHGSIESTLPWRVAFVCGTLAPVVVESRRWVRKVIMISKTSKSE